MRISILTGAAVGVLLAALPTGSARAQHEHADHGDEGDLSAEGQEGAHDAPAMVGPIGIPMTRDGSGTAWQPDANTMRALHASAAGWTFMLHGLFFAGYSP